MFRPDQYREIVCNDWEFYAPDGERPTVRCLSAHELISGRVHRLFEDDLQGLRYPPYPVDAGSLFVAYYSPAEFSCHLAMGWPLPANVLDLYVEFRNRTNGLTLPCGRSLLGALLYYGLPAIGADEKDEMRQLAIRGGPYTDLERQQLLDYCEGDVIALRRLLDVMY